MVRDAHGTFAHRPVLLSEVLAALCVRDEGVYIDATFGRGGHSAAILQRLGPRGRLIVIDRDPEAIAVARERFGHDLRVRAELASFSQMEALCERQGLVGAIDGIVMDLGVSSPQLDDEHRGFSFLRDGPLDMRMDRRSGRSAADWLASASEEEMARVFAQYGEERFSRRIARSISVARAREPIATTARLAEVVAATVPRREKGKHPSTRVFLALRLLLNDELGELRRGLEQVPRLLQRGGRLVVISFHSLEDRIVKRFIRDESRGGSPPPRLPLRRDQLQLRLRPIGQPLRPSPREVVANPRARSAVLRVAERL